MLTFRYVCQSFFPIKHPQHYDQWQLFNRERRMGRMRRRHGACLLAFLCPAHSSVPGRDMCSLYTYTRVGMRGRGWEARKPTRRFPPRKEKKRGRRGIIPRTHFVCCCICNLPLWFYRRGCGWWPKGNGYYISFKKSKRACSISIQRVGLYIKVSARRPYA